MVFIPNFHSCQCYNKLIGERAKRVRHPLSLPIEKNVWVVRQTTMRMLTIYLKWRRGRTCIYEKPTCCSRMQLRKALFTYVKTSKRMHIKQLNFRSPLNGNHFSSTIASFVVIISDFQTRFNDEYALPTWRGTTVKVDNRSRLTFFVHRAEADSLSS